MNITANIHITALDDPVTKLDISGNGHSIFKIGGGTEVTLFITGKPAERVEYIDNFLVVLQELRRKALRQAGLDEELKTVSVPAGIELPHDRPFHLGFEPTCAACLIERKIKHSLVKASDGNA